MKYQCNEAMNPITGHCSLRFYYNIFDYGECRQTTFFKNYLKLEFHGRLTPALNSSCSPSKIYSGREFAPHRFQWAEYEQV